MKLKENLVLRQVADSWVVLPLSSASIDFNGMLTLNESGVLLWRVLEKGADREALAKALTEEYNVTLEQARVDVDDFCSVLIQAGCVEE